ncbi:hypothetical protein ANRL3_02568 [Anaerolineae bacterium]|nr:hypothetical protein ANRL3_02568 [Anaerolineae bacterium]
MILLLDNTVLSNFARVERPDLVQRALGDAERAATVTEAFAEFQAGVRNEKTRVIRRIV